MTSPRTLTDGEHRIDGEPRPLDRALRQRYPGASWAVVRRAVRSGKVQVDGRIVRDPVHPVAAGSRIQVRMSSARRPRVALDDDVLVHVDAQLVVVRKPPGIVCVPDARHRRDTLAQRIQALLPRRGRRTVPLGVVQRLDRDTSGLLVFTRTRDARLALKEQLGRRAVARHYLAVVAGRARAKVYRSHLTERRDGKRGSTRRPRHGQYACTHVSVVEHLAGATLVRCELETGRTHQIRIHLSEAGHPLLGDRRYARRGIVCPPAPRVMLHAASLGFVHPTTGRALQFDEPLPPDMAEVADELRK